MARRAGDPELNYFPRAGISRLNLRCAGFCSTFTENHERNRPINVDFSLKKGYIHTLNFVMIAENIKLLRERIERKCREVNRDVNDVKLIAVSKTFGTGEILKVYDEGLR